MFLSTDGGATWLDSDSDGTNDSIFNGANQTYTKNVKVTVNTATGVASLWFDGTKVGDYTQKTQQMLLNSDLLVPVRHLTGLFRTVSTELKCHNLFKVKNRLNFQK